MQNPTLMSECSTDVEKIRLWKNLLSTENMTIESAISMINEDESGNWISHDDSRSYFTIPSFQRDYTYTSKQKTSLIESILLNIPIGSILVYQEPTENGGRTLPIIDGQHRLKTIQDFIQNRFKLNGRHLMFLTSLEGKRFQDLDPEFSNSFLEYTLTVLKARKPGGNISETIEEFSNQCFIRMNENPNAMSPYTLLKARYSSHFFAEYDHMLNVIFSRDKQLRDIFLVSTRGQNDRHKIDITAVLYALNNGLDPKYKDVKSIAELLITNTVQMNDEQAEEYVDSLSESLVSFSRFLCEFRQYGIVAPLTQQIVGEKTNPTSLNKGIMIRMALIYYTLKQQDSVQVTDRLVEAIKSAFSSTYKEDTTLQYNNLNEFVDVFLKFLTRSRIRF